MAQKLAIGLLMIVAGALILYSGINSIQNPPGTIDTTGFPPLIPPGQQNNLPPAPNPNQPPPLYTGPVTNFDQCVAAGNPILETYPEQCKTPQGQTFTRPTSHTGCLSDAECTAGYYCKGGLCSEFIPDKSCSSNNECTLIDVTRRFSCCWSGACDAINYSHAKWIAVNAEWYSTNRMNVCPSADQCGPAPGCPTQIENDQYRAVCVNHQCEKESIPSS